MKEDLQFYSDTIPFLLQNDEIKWIIGFIRNILEKIPEQVFCPLTITEEQKLFLYQEKIKQQLDFLRTVESYIELISREREQENIEFRNYITINKGHSNKQKSAQTDGIEVIGKINPSLESMNNYHKITRIFCALVSCSAYAMFLNYEVSAIGKKPTETVLAELEQNKQLHDSLKKNEKLFTEIKKLIINRNEIDEEKTGILSIAQCVILIERIKTHYVEKRKKDCEDAGIPTETVKEVKERSIRRYVEYWDQTLKGNKKQGRELPRKDYSRNMSMEDYSKLFNDIELDEYNKWRARNKIYELTRKKKNK